jgi:hypothetical protein
VEGSKDSGDAPAFGWKFNSPAGQPGASPDLLPRLPRRKGTATNSIAARVVAVLACACTAFAQSRGVADIAAQGYYQGGDSTKLQDISGLSASFRDFIPHLGLLSGSLEGYGRQGSFEPGSSFLELKGAPWLGSRWTLTGGDFRTEPSAFQLPFTNLYYPEISARGFRIEASEKDARYSLFVGQETLLSGPRVPYRLVAPQSVAGAMGQRTIGHFQFGVRLLRLWSSAKSIDENPYLFAPDRRMLSANTATLQSMYSLKSLKIYAEAGTSAVQSTEPQGASGRMSAMAAVSWDTPALTVRANYALLGPSYLPIVGYYAGDRRGPFGELRYRFWRRLEFYGSASRYENNLSHRDDIPTLSTSMVTAGASSMLPSKFSVSAQFSLIGLTTSIANPESLTDSRNRQLTANIARPLGRHTVRLTGRDLKLGWLGRSDRQRSLEAEDYFSYKHFTLGAAVRAQEVGGSTHQDTVFGRCSAQARFGRLTAYTFFEGGKDLVNQTVFSVNTLKTTTAGTAVAITRFWNLSADVFRYSLNSETNPANAFVLGSSGIGVSTALSGMNMWNFYFRVARTFQWGAPFEAGGLDRYAMDQIRLTGSIEGFVYAGLHDGPRPVAGIPVSLDRTRIAHTDAEGRYRFAEVPEGVRNIAIAVQELPAEFDPGPPADAVAVRPGRVVRADLTVFPLTRLTGTVLGPAGANLDNVLVRLLPTARYTTTDNKGNFAFENLREGDYELTVDAATLPGHAVITSAARVPVAVRCGSPAPPVEFHLEIPPEEKPVRKVFTHTL